MQGFETSAGLVFQDSNLPVLQDDGANRVMNNWAAVQRDFVIINGDNEEVARYNLTSDSLDIPQNRDRVRDALIDAAGD